MVRLASREHLAEDCRDEECPRFPCVMFRRGYEAGFRDGFGAGFGAGEAAGYAAGYSAGAASVTSG